MKFLNDVHVGTLGGTLCSLLFRFPLEDLFRTAITAAVGAAVSFAVSRLLNRGRRR